MNFHSSIEKKIGDRTIADICYGVRSGEGTAKFNQIATPPVPGPAVLQTAPIGSAFVKPVGFSKVPIAPQAVTPTGSHQSFSAIVPPITSQPPSNVFQNAVNTPGQNINVFQKAASTANQILNPFQKALHSTRSSTQPITSAFGPKGQGFSAAPAFGSATHASSGFATATPLAPASQTSFSPVSLFSPANGTLDTANIFKKPVVNRPGLFKPTIPLNTLTQPPVPQHGPAGVSPGGLSTPQASSSSTIAASPQVAFQFGPPKVSGGFFQPQTTSSSSSQSVFKSPSQAISGGLFQPQSFPAPSLGPVAQPNYFQKAFQPSTSTSFSTSQSVFNQTPKASLSDLFQPNNSSPELTTNSSFFPPSPANSTNSPNGGSVFESHSVQNHFPTNFFSVPSGTPGDYEEENEDNDATIVPAPTLASSSLFDRIQAPTQDLLPQSNTITQKAVSSSKPAPLFSSSPSTVSNTSPASSAPSESVHSFLGTSFIAPTSPATQQVVTSKQPLLSRAAAWNFANKLFDDIISEEVTKTIQEAVNEDSARIIQAVAAEKYVEQEKFVAKKIALDIAADRFYFTRSGANAFYSWKKKTRKLTLRKLRAERLLRESLPAPVQWRPVKIPEWVFDGPHDVIQQMNNATYKSVPLKEIFQPKVEAAFWSTGEGDRKWRLLINSTNLKQDANNYWWIEKMIGNNKSRISTSKKGTFEVQFQMENPNEEVREIGGFVFGCSADYSISNDERFAQDKKNLHDAVNWLSERTGFPKLVVMVVCYRSPLDNEDADPFGRDLGRTSGPGRQARISAVSCQPEGFSTINIVRVTDINIGTTSRFGKHLTLMH